MFSCLMAIDICVIHSCSLNSFCSFVNFNSHRIYTHTLSCTHIHLVAYIHTHEYMDRGWQRATMYPIAQRTKYTNVCCLGCSHTRRTSLCYCFCFYTSALYFSQYAHKHSHTSHVCRNRMTTRIRYETYQYTHIHPHPYNETKMLAMCSFVTLLQWKRDVCVHKCGSGMVSIVS